MKIFPSIVTAVEGKTVTFSSEGSCISRTPKSPGLNVLFSPRFIEANNFLPLPILIISGFIRSIFPLKGMSLSDNFKYAVISKFNNFPSLSITLANSLADKLNFTSNEFGSTKVTNFSFLLITLPGSIFTEEIIPLKGDLNSV